jgi:transposase
MFLQPDFRAQNCDVQDAIETQAHLCTFLPKFHPELNWIEHFWGHKKIQKRANLFLAEEIPV